MRAKTDRISAQVAGSTYKFHLLPSGLVHPKTTCVIGNGVVIHLPSFFNEIDSITAPADGGKPLEVGLSSCSACCRAWLLPRGQQGLWAGFRRSVLQAKRGEEVGCGRSDVGCLGHRWRVGF